VAGGGARPAGRPSARIGVLVGLDENDPAAKLRVSAFTQVLADLGWTAGRNVRIGLRWGGGDINRIRARAQELVGLSPDIIVTNATYVDRILRGKPGDLPVQFPVKYKMVVNLRTAKALGLAVPLSIRLRADEVME
jgi:ABC-type uncharacterized transport system substrate-binding protein